LLIQTTMQYNSIHECYARVYANGLVVFTKPHSLHERTDGDLQRQAKIKRTYTIHKSKVRSACVAAWKVKKSKYMLFLTFTFPCDVTEAEAADIWNRMLKNLKQNYKVNYYVWVKERQKIGRLHYHILVDRNRLDVQALQRSWNNAIRHVLNIHILYNNSVRLGGNPIVRSIESVSKYLSKYISKGELNGDERSTDFEQKAYGFTDHLVISARIDTDIVEMWFEKYGVRHVHNDNFYDIFKINTNFLDLSSYISDNTS
jgi:hypothetical protein